MSIDSAKTILVIGATSGIGRALALPLAALPSKPTVIAAGRRQERLDELASQGLEAVQLDVAASREVLQKNVADILAKYPNLDAIILASGIQYQHNFKSGINLDEIHQEFTVNYFSIVTLVSLFIPHFLALSEKGLPSWISPITSGLALMPAPQVINYSASKAALHSFSESLRVQLADTKINVLEIIPPLVESELHDAQGTTEALSKFWMPLDEYTSKTLDGLRKGDKHIAVGTAGKVWDKVQSSGLDGPYKV
ncbi:hypothetical protein MIND_00457000 [Mycena indigotica]|uniref:NAD(P)-binding protein n=1 Tax=Mycena indigotica TaxID=2126181 RepID=A0A8H6WBS9_9AGAR|nr:uncharacterized protein MIND_00457000 [Mycena indigotica]KAF7306654.1 hypothetical protein MIND_00457000 [Mycena indigotica]